MAERSYWPVEPLDEQALVALGDPDVSRSSWQPNEFDPLEVLDELPSAPELPPGNPTVPLAMEELLQLGTGKSWEPTFLTATGYDSNIFLRENNVEGDVVSSVAGGMTGAWGRPEDNAYFAFEYTATAIFFVENPDQNALNHELKLRFSHQWSKMRAGMLLDYAYLTGADRQVGGFATRNVIRGGFEVRHELTARTTMGVEGGLSSEIYEDFINSNRFAANIFVDWEATVKTTLGLGLGGGFSLPGEGPTEMFETIELRWRYEMSEKFRLQATGGLAFRQYSGGESRIGWVFDGRAEWNPTEKLTLALRAYHNENTSPVAVGENFIATGAEAILQYPFLGIMVLDVAAGFENDAYEGVESTVSTDRNDNYFFIRPTVTAILSPRFSLGLYYELRENRSNAPGSSFENHRFGLEAKLLF